MKKLFIYILIIAVFGTVFGGILHNLRNTTHDNPEVSIVLDYITPVIAYADSDTIGGPGFDPPPPPPIWIR